MQSENEFSSPSSSILKAQLILESHRALLRCLREDTFMLDTCPPEVLSWLEEHCYIEEVLDDNNEFHFDMTAEGRAAVIGHFPQD